MADKDVNLMESPPDKAVLVGDVGVGKTSLFVRFKTGEFSENVSHNPREGEYQKKWAVQGKQISVSVLCRLVWSTSSSPLPLLDSGDLIALGALIINLCLILEKLSKPQMHFLRTYSNSLFKQSPSPHNPHQFFPFKIPNAFSGSSIALR